MKVRAAKEFGDFAAPLRNICVRLDGLWLQLDLVPSQTVDAPPDINFDDDPVLKRLTAGAQLIVEATSFLRLTFDQAPAIKIHEEFAAQYADEHLNAALVAVEKLPGGGIWPICEIIDSPWLATFPDYTTAGHPLRRHWKMWCMETSVDVIGDLPTAEWMSKIQST